MKIPLLLSTGNLPYSKHLSLPEHGDKFCIIITLLYQAYWILVSIFFPAFSAVFLAWQALSYM